MAILGLLPFADGLGRVLGPGEERGVRDALASLSNAATQAWPTLAFDADVFAHYLGTRAADEAAADETAADETAAEGKVTTQLEDRLLALPIGDLLLAFCCAQGSSDAIAAFEATHFVPIQATLARLGLAHFLDEVRQSVRDQLFVSKGRSAPRILTLAGNGDLTSLVRVVATRTALNLRRRDVRLAPDGNEQLAQCIANEASPSAQSMQVQERAAFKAAFEAAVAKLDDRSRGVLRMHLLHRMNISQIAELYDVHRATTARWLGQIRDDLDMHTREELRERHALGATELDSLVKIAKSKIDISFERLLATKTA